MDTVIAWACWHPLLSLAIMTGTGLLVGALTIRPHLSEVLHRDHPRC